jgi:hypothetical protein
MEQHQTLAGSSEIEAPRPPQRGARPTLAARLVHESLLADREREGMFKLLSRHFYGVEPKVFARDLQDKNWVILLEDEAGILRGFSTFLIYGARPCGRAITVVYSGDTIVEPAAWGTSALPRAWFRAIYDLRRDYPGDEIYWLLLTSGYRTYRFLPLLCRIFYPRFDAPTPATTQQMLDALSAERFGTRYDKSAGIVRFSKPQVLRDDLVGVPEGRCDDPHVRFFLSRNPRHAEGDELVSLASLNEEHLTLAGKRMLR